MTHMEMDTIEITFICLEYLTLGQAMSYQNLKILYKSFA
jgi:hypothetical protein